MALEEEFYVVISDRDAETMITIKAIINYIK
jgi:acyl carrier protein